VGQGIVERARGGSYRLLKPGLSREAVAAASRACRNREEQDRRTLQRMVDYAEGRGCRWRMLLEYFDDDALLLGPCHHCDCDPAVPDELTRLAALRKTVEAMATM
jgi:ATP-dependent DNA helicase RecQ